MSHSDITNLGKASLKRGLPPCEDQVVQARQKFRASTSRYSIQDLKDGFIARDAEPLRRITEAETILRKGQVLHRRGREPSKLISGPGGSRFKMADTTEPLLDRTIRLLEAENMLAANGIDSRTLHPQQVANFAKARPAAQRRSIATYLQNLKSHELTPAATRNSGSIKTVDATISRDNTAGDQARVTANLSTISRKNMLVHRPVTVYHQPEE